MGKNGILKRVLAIALSIAIVFAMAPGLEYLGGGVNACYADTGCKIAVKAFDKDYTSSCYKGYVISQDDLKQLLGTKKTVCRDDLKAWLVKDYDGNKAKFIKKACFMKTTGYSSSYGCFGFGKTALKYKTGLVVIFYTKGCHCAFDIISNHECSFDAKTTGCHTDWVYSISLKSEVVNADILPAGEKGGAVFTNEKGEEVTTALLGQKIKITVKEYEGYEAQLQTSCNVCLSNDGVFTVGICDAVAKVTYRKILTVTDIAANSREYDGTNVAVISNKGKLSGVSGSDCVEVKVEKALFEDKNVGNDKKVTVCYVLTGKNAGKYVIKNQTVYADITPKQLQIDGTIAENKKYDGNTKAKVIPGKLIGVIKCDCVYLESVTGQFQDPNAGEGKDVAVKYVLAGKDAKNYSLPDGATTAAIKKAANAISNFECGAILANETPNPSADALAGTVSFTFSKSKDGPFGPWKDEYAKQGTYYVKAVAPETENYYSTEVVKQCKVNKAANAITNFKCDNILSNEAPKPSADALAGKVVFTYSDNPNGPFGPWKDEYSKPGTYYVKAVAPETDKYYSTKEIKPFTVEKAANTISDFECENIYPDGTPNPSADALAGKVVFTYSDDPNGPFGPWEDTYSKPGTYYVKAVSPDTDKYYSTKEVKSFKVKKLANTISDFECENIYLNGTPNPSAGALEGNVVFTYSDDPNGPFEPWSDNFNKAGTYYVKAVSPDTDSYYSTKEIKSFKVRKIENTISNFECDSIYTNVKPEPSADALDGTVEFTYSKDKNGPFGAWKSEYAKAGTYYVKAVSPDTTSYYSMEAVKSFKVKAIATNSIAKMYGGTKSITLSWNSVAGAAKYKIYFNSCGLDNTCKYLKTTTDKSVKITGLKKGVAYKGYVVAYDKSGKKLYKTPIAHAMTKGGKNANPTKVTAAATKSIAVGGTASVGAKIVKKSWDGAYLSILHTSLMRYYSADKSIATVDENGKVKGVKKGTVNIYSVSISGVYAVTQVTVK